MRKIFNFISIALLITAVSCNKDILNPATEDQVGVPMTLTLTIGEPETRVATTDDELAKKLSFAWEAGDKVSVVSLNGGGSLIANDIFTTAAGGTTATFSGTFTGGEAAKVVVFYPALTESYVEAETTKWRVPRENGYSGSTSGILEGLSSTYISIRDWAYTLQTALDSPSHLKNYMILRGEADIDDIKTGNLTVNLEHMTTVLKVKLTLPSAGLTLTRASITMKKADDGYLNNVGQGWGWLGQLKSYSVGGSTNHADICLGSQVSSGTGTGLTAVGNTATVYIPFTLKLADKIGSGSEWLTMTAGQKFDLIVETTTGDYSQTLVFSADRDLKPGKLYTINAAPTAP